MVVGTARLVNADGDGGGASTRGGSDQLTGLGGAGSGDVLGTSEGTANGGGTVVDSHEASTAERVLDAVTTATSALEGNR